jgi:ferredoxin/menaquinone-dependent protoporphyrinogen IX oxidase
MIAQVNTLFFSPTETTAQICKQIANSLGCKTVDYDLSLLKQRKKYANLSFKNNELLIVGIPVYSGRIPELLEDYFMKLKGNNTPAVFVVVYGNRDYDDALLELKNIFENRGFRAIAAAAFIGEHSFTAEVANNRPDALDLETAVNFGLEIKQKLNDLPKLTDQQLFVKGNFPYKERLPFPAMGPQTNDNCINCGVCAEVCSVEAIDFTDFKNVDIEKCIRCNCCVKNCPQNAKTFTHETFIKIEEKLIKNFLFPRKEPELFY